MTEILPNVLIPTVAAEHWAEICPSREPHEKEPLVFVQVQYRGVFQHRGHEGFMFTWAAKKCGFGEFTFYRRQGETCYQCDTEYMGDGFVVAALKHWLDNGGTAITRKKKNRRWCKKRRILDVQATVEAIVANPKNLQVWVALL